MKKILLALAFLFSVSAVNAAVSMKSKFDVDFYGYIKGQARYNTGQTSTHEFNLWVISGNPDTRQFRIHARETRFGFNIKANENVSGKIEADFVGAAGATTDLRLRHAFVNLNYGKWDFLFGQYWHLTPLIFPFSNSADAFGGKGCLWNRIPQMRATYTINDVWQTAFAFVRPTFLQVDDSGTNEGRPTLQAYLKAKYGGSTFWLSSALGRRRNPVNPDQHGDVYLADFGYSIPFSIFTLHGQVWGGQNLYDFLVAALQVGYDGSATPPVRAYGGYASLKIKPWQKTWFGVGVGIDDPVDNDIPVNGLTQNIAGFVNITFLVFDNVELALETGVMETQYKNAFGGIRKEGIHMYEFSAKFPF